MPGSSTSADTLAEGSPAAAATAFLTRFAGLLDDGRFAEWLDLCTADVSYIARSAESHVAGDPVALINDDRDRLRGRIASIERFWHAESPRTRTTHLVTNVAAERGDDGALEVRSYFLVIAVRRDKRSELSGRYLDRLVTVDDALRLQRRLAIFNENLLTDGRITFIV